MLIANDFPSPHFLVYSKPDSEKKGNASSFKKPLTAEEFLKPRGRGLVALRVQHLWILTGLCTVFVFSSILLGRMQKSPRLYGSKTIKLNKECGSSKGKLWHAGLQAVPSTQVMWEWLWQHTWQDSPKCGVHRFKAQSKTHQSKCLHGLLLTNSTLFILRPLDLA